MACDYQLHNSTFVSVRSCFNFSVIKPLNTAIRSLNEAIAAMRAQLHEVDEKRQHMAERLAKAEASAASAHHRIDGLETRIHRHDRQN